MRSLTKRTTWFILTALLAACTLGGKATPPPGGHCANPLFPVVAGAIWEYQALNPVGNYTLSQQVASVGEQGFTMTVQYSTGVTTDMPWACELGDLIQLQAGNGPAGMMSSLGGTSGVTETDRYSGLTLPGSVTAGDTWKQYMEIGGQVFLPSRVTGTAEGTYRAEFTAIGLELVTVPAGTFHAMLIEVQAVYDLLITVEKLDLPFPFPTSSKLWYAPGVGLVRAENTNEATAYEIIELLRYSSP